MPTTGKKAIGLPFPGFKAGSLNTNLKKETFIV
jgi:hypothetical protein